jgi:hypothetical protein
MLKFAQVINLSKEWFREPLQQDISILAGETIFDWLNRDTSSRAYEIRKFLNFHINKLPIDWQEKMFQDLKYKWNSAYFELVCARVLQELGVEELKIEQNKLNSDESASLRKPDFTTKFPNSSCFIVEATSTETDKAFKDEISAKNPLYQIIESHLPVGFAYDVFSLPNIGPSDSKKKFSNVLKERFRSLQQNSQRIDIEIDSGLISLQVYPFDTEYPCQFDMSYPTTFSNNSKNKDIIVKAINRKRTQVRDSILPVILAINTIGISAKEVDFDRALFGAWVGHKILGTKEPRPSFDPNGIFTKRQTNKPPTYSGILAFFNIGPSGGQYEPVLYVHPDSTFEMPKELLQFKTKRYCKLKNEITIQEPSKQLNDFISFPSF